MQYKSKTIQKYFFVPETNSECIHMKSDDCIYYDKGCKCDIEFKE